MGRAGKLCLYPSVKGSCCRSLLIWSISRSGCSNTKDKQGHGVKLGRDFGTSAGKAMYKCLSPPARRLPATLGAWRSAAAQGCGCHPPPPRPGSWQCSASSELLCKRAAVTPVGSGHLAPAFRLSLLLFPQALGVRPRGSVTEGLCVEGGSEAVPSPGPTGTSLSRCLPKLCATTGSTSRSRTPSCHPVWPGIWVRRGCVGRAAWS